MRPPWLSAVALSSSLLLGACRDESAERFAHARASYDTLLERGQRPDAPAFDEVLRELESIPAGSAHGPEARRLAGAIRQGRAPRAPSPLALGPKAANRPAELEAVLARCAQLAAEAGRDGGVDQRALSALEDCRRRAEVLDIRFAHGDEPDGGLPHAGH